MAIRNSMRPITLVSFDSAGMTSSYQPMNATGLEKACSFIKIVNDSNISVFISYDGATDHDFLINGTTLEINLQANANPNESVANFPKGRIVYLKSASAGTGLLYLIGYYQ